MKRYALRSCKSKPAMESSSDVLVHLGDAAFPVATRASLESGMGMGMKVIISVMVGLVTGIIAKFFSSSFDDGSASLQKSVDNFNETIEQCKEEIISYDIKMAQTSQARVKNITEEVWEDSKTQKYLMSNLFAATNFSNGSPDYTLIEMTRQLCSHTSMLSVGLNRTLYGQRDSESLNFVMAKFEEAVLGDFYSKVCSVRESVGLSRNVTKDVPSLLQALGELNTALKAENEKITEQKAKDQLKSYVQRNDNLKLESLTVGAIQGLEKSAKDNMDVILANLTMIEKQLEKDGDTEDSEHKKAAIFLGQLNSLCGKFIAQISKVSKASERMMTVYVAAMKKDAGQEKEINPK